MLEVSWCQPLQPLTSVRHPLLEQLASRTIVELIAIPAAVTRAAASPNPKLASARKVLIAAYWINPPPAVSNSKGPADSYTLLAEVLLSEYYVLE